MRMKRLSKYFTSSIFRWLHPPSSKKLISETPSQQTLDTTITMPLRYAWNLMSSKKKQEKVTKKTRINFKVKTKPASTQYLVGNLTI